MSNQLMSVIAAVLGLSLLVGVIGGAFYYRFQGVKVGPYQGAYVKATGFYDMLDDKLTGTVENISSQKLKHVEIRASFYDEDVLVDKARDGISNLGSGEKYRFEIWPEANITMGKVELEAVTQQ